MAKLKITRANGDYTHQKYLRFREWYFQNYDGSKRNAVRDFKMFESAADHGSGLQSSRISTG